MLLGALFALAVAGCGQPPPSDEGQGGGGGNEAASEEATGGETTAEETTAEETTTEETTAEGAVSEETTGAMAVGGRPELAAAADGYEEYVVEQVTLLEERTEGFTDAVISGDVDEAKSTGPAGRQNLACCQSPRRNPPSPYPIRVKIAHSGDAPRRSRVRCPRDRDGEEVSRSGILRQGLYMTTPATGGGNDGTGVLARAALAGAACFTLSALLLSLFSEYTLAGDYISELAIGRFGSVQTLAFLAFGIAVRRRWRLAPTARRRGPGDPSSARSFSGSSALG